MKPQTVWARRNMEGKCLTRTLTIPLRMVIVCSGTSCLNATRKAAWSATEPWSVVQLTRQSANKKAEFSLGLTLNHHLCWSQTTRHKIARPRSSKSRSPREQISRTPPTPKLSPGSSHRRRLWTQQEEE